MPQDILVQFVALWVVIDPIGTIPVFVAVAKNEEPAARSRMALSARRDARRPPGAAS